MGVREDLTTAAGHVAGRRTAVMALSESMGDTIDVVRLRDDVVRLADAELGPHGDLGRG